MEGGVSKKDNELSVKVKDDYCAPTAIMMLYNVIDARQNEDGGAGGNGGEKQNSKANENKHALASARRRI